MKSITYGYGNNGLFPYRYIKKRPSNLSETFVNPYKADKNKQSAETGNINSLKNLCKGYLTKGVSENTQRKIAKHCRVLGLSAEKRKVRNSKGNYIDHLCSFITLTLPCEQIHDDAEITKVILGTFLDKSRKLGLLQNYVWRAEKQKNGNIHYHILTDTFANFSMFRRLWYVALRRLDYLTRYTEKFSKMSYSEYHKQSFNAGKTPAQTATAYARGVRCRWSEPASCHVSYPNDISAVSKYVSKYTSKKDSNTENIVTGRVWSCSQSVSNAVKNFCSDGEFSKYWYHLGVEMMKRKTISTDFFSMVLFSYNSLVGWFTDSGDYAKTILQQFFQPCQFWKNSVGLQLE